MRTFQFVCFEIELSSQQPLCCFAKTEIKSDFKCVFTVIYILLNKSLARVNKKYFFHLSKWFNDIKYLLK